MQNQNPSAASGSGYPRAEVCAEVRERHERHVAAEARRLEGELLKWGPMPREELAARAGASHWRDGTFVEALQAGERQGRLRLLPLGWVAAAGHLGPAQAQ
ncbi:MAG TPA: hypothetical protein VME01_10800 [Solirubrobacteraceae bacterium]|nr:hypothetical protein [Solirubrobacteraceae bacterium]